MGILIENAIVITDPIKDEFLHSHSVYVRGSEITNVGKTEELRSEYPNAERIDGSGMMLLPGLIDCHTHLYAALTLGMPSIGEPPQNFPQILSRIWWRWDKALRDEDLEISAIVGCIASMRNGITTIVDHHASPSAVQDSLSHLAAGVDKCGLRACFAYEVSDRDGEDSKEQGINENRRFILEMGKEGDGRTCGLFGLHAVFSLSDETLRQCAEVSEELGVGCHLHVAEHRPEVEKFAETHSEGIVQFLVKIGILKPKSIAAHTVHLDEESIQALVQSGAFNVHNPKSNMGNGVGIARVGEMIAAGQPVCLGSDGFYNVPQEMEIARLLQILEAGNPSAFSGELALRMAYDHGSRLAHALFNRDFGKIVEGYVADIILVAYDPPTPVLKENLTSHIRAALNSRAVDTLMVAGRVLMRGGELLGVEEKEVFANARPRAKSIWNRL